MADSTLDRVATTDPASTSTSTSTSTTAPPTPTTGERVSNPRRVAANRRNAAKSTGPKTEAGKARSRANALKHGLAGLGICLPSEDAALAQERCLQLHEEMAPTTVQGMMLVEMMAIAHTRMKRAVRQEVAALTYAQRCAPILYDDARLTEAEENLRLLAIETRTRHRHLLESPEGIDLLLESLSAVRAEVRNPQIRWNYIHGQCLERFCGRDYSDPLQHSRGRALSLALEFEDTELTAADKAEIAEAWGGRIKEWARPQMEALIDAEVARLQAIRLTLDHAGIARTRAEAAERALFDASREACLARRYEAAATRTFLRALKEYGRVEAEAAAAAAVAPTEAPAPLSQARPAGVSALDPPSRATAQALAAGDRLRVVDPADRAAPPAPERRRHERPVLASSGITVAEASAIISQPHYSQPPVPFDQPAPRCVGTVVPPPPRRGAGPIETC